MAAPAAFPLPSPEVIRRTALAVTRRPEYRLDEAPRVFEMPAWVDRVLHAMARAIGRVFEGLFAISPVLGYVVVGILSIAGALLVFRIGLHVYRVVSKRRRLRGGPAMGGGAEDRPETWEEMALRAVAARDFMGAARHLLRSSLLFLSAARKRPFPRGATNREWLDRYRDTALSAPISSFVNVIDARWYGGLPCSEEDYVKCRTAHDTIRRLAESVHVERA
jgi:hypothetical protein